VRVPRARDRGKSGVKFSSTILPPPPPLPSAFQERFGVSGQPRERSGGSRRCEKWRAPDSRTLALGFCIELLNACPNASAFMA
jgi:hypothetical protein